MKKNAIDPDDAAPLTGDELKRPDVKWRIGGREVPPEEGKAAFRKAFHGKTRTNIHFDNDVIAYYKAKAGPRGYQTLINAALRRDMERSELKAELKAEIKAELNAELSNVFDFFARITPALMVNTPIVPMAFVAHSRIIFEVSPPIGPVPTMTSSGGQFFGLATPTQGSA
jgi:hypothetical protein